MENNFIGKTFISENLKNSIDSFWIVIDDGVAINPFDFICVPSTGNTKTVGMVKEIERIYLFSDNRFKNYYFSSYCNLQDNENVVGKGITVAKIAVMSSIAYQKDIPESYEHTSLSDIDKEKSLLFSNMPIEEGKPVVFANSAEVIASLGIPKMENPIPAGIIEMTNGTRIPIDMDISYMFGPDTAHVNASGISGNMKTSYLLFLLQSMYQRLLGNGISLILFNTKEKNLLSIDKSNEEEFIKNDQEIFNLLKLKLIPFDNVKYFLPRGKNGKPLSSFIPENNYKTFSYELGDIYDRLDLLFSSETIQDPRYNISSIINYIYESWPLNINKNKKLTTWTELINFEDYPEEIVTHKSTLLKFKGSINRFRKPSTLFIDKKNTSVYLGDEIKKLKKSDVLVIDIASLPSLEEQAFVIGDVLRTVDELYSIGHARPILKNPEYKNTNNYTLNEKPKYIGILLDEINRFLPSHDYYGSNSASLTFHRTAVSEEILKTLISGKSRHVILLSAQQFKSQVDPILNDNTGLHIIAKLGLSELSTKHYLMIDDTTKSTISKLHKGEIVLIHPAFRHPIKITIPKPTFKKP